MAFSLGAFPNETIFVECRAFVFFFSSDIKQWMPVRDKGVYSKIQLVCQRTPSTSGSSGLYRIYGRLETSGFVTLDVTLQPAVRYFEAEPTWHQIQDVKVIYGLRISPSSDASKFALVVQSILRSIQVSVQGFGTTLPPPIPVGACGPPTSLPGFGDGALPTPLQQQAPEVQREVPLQGRRQKEKQIEQLCSSLSTAIQIGDQGKVVEISRRLGQQKVALSIKLKNPAHIPMDKGSVPDLNLRVFVEDKEYSGGAFTMKVAPTRQIEELQQEVFDRYGFPVQVQKWIVGKRISKPSETLRDCGIKPPGGTAFLYLVSGKSVRLRKTDALRATVRTDNASTTADDTEAASAGGNLARTVSMPVLNTTPRSAAAEGSSRHPGQGVPPSSAAENNHAMGISELQAIVTSQLYGGQESRQHQDVNSQMQLHTTSLVTNVSPREEQTSAMAPAQEGEERLSIPIATNEPEGWQCPKCTLINVPTRPGCEACSSDRPVGYVVPDYVNVDAREHARIEEELRQLGLFEEAGRANYSMENILQSFLATTPDVEDGPRELSHPVHG